MKTKYKILVLSDLKNTTNNALKSAISLAKIIDANIEFFHVKKPTEIVENDNQLSAMRSINKEYTTIEKKIKKLIAPISKEYDMSIHSTFSFGNVKDEITKHIQEHQPDIIVLGKKKSNPLKISGDYITDFVLKNYNGSVMIASNNNVLEPNKELSLGILNDVEPSLNMNFANDLLNNTQQPLKSFKINNNANRPKGIKLDIDKKIVEYVFEQNDNSIKNLSNYVSKNNINLFCINKDEKNDIVKTDIKEIISKFNVPVLVSA